MIMTSKFQVKVDKDGNHRIVSKETLPCPICGGHLAYLSLRMRIVIDIESDNVVITLIIRRLKCDKCGKIHHELPEGLVVPYKRYCAETIKKIINGDTNTGVSCENKTISRTLDWWSTVKPYFSAVLKSLTEKFGVRFSEPATFYETIRAVVNSNNWIFARAAMNPE